MEAEVLWIPIISIIGSFTMIIAVVWLVTRARQRTAQYRAEVQLKLIDRFGSANEITQFLESPTGRQFLDTPRRTGRERVLWGIRSGIILIFLGIAFSFGYFTDHDPGWMVPALIIGALGVGFLISSIVSLRLAQKWEVVNGAPKVNP